MFTRPRYVLMAFAASSLLGGCFVSETPLIPHGHTVLPKDHGITLCVDGPDDCINMVVEGDGYATPATDEGEPAAARFAPLMQVNGRQVFLLEAHDTDDGAYTYLVARKRSNTTEGPSDLELALISCDDLTEPQRVSFESRGGIIRGGWGDECIAPNLETLITTVREAYAESLGDEAWWAQGGTE